MNYLKRGLDKSKADFHGERPCFFLSACADCGQCYVVSETS